MENNGWKQVGSVFETDGNILEAGEFTISNGDTVILTESDIEELYNNLKEPVPFAIGHGENAQIIGQAMQFIKNGNVVEHKGIVYNSDTFKNYILGKNKTAISPEIDIVKDKKTGKITKKISSLRFVTNPAISGNTTEITRLMFSAPEFITSNVNSDINTDNSNDNVMTEQTESSAPASPPNSNMDVAKIAEAITNGLSKKFEEQITVLNNKIAELESKNKTVTPPKELIMETTSEPITPEVLTEYKAAPPISKEVFEEYKNAQLELAKKNEELEKLRKANEQTLNDKLNTIIGDLKKYKYENPDQLLTSLPIEARISALEEMRRQAVTQTSMTSPSDIEMDGGGRKRKEKEKSYLELCKEAGIDIGPGSSFSMEHAERRAKELGIPLGIRK